jgi:hypothetical protein
MTEDDLDARECGNGCPLLEALVVSLAVLECVVVTAAAVWLDVMSAYIETDY